VTALARAAILVAGLAAAQELVRVDFRNRIPGVLDAPVYDFDGTTRLATIQFMAALYVSGEGPDSLSQVGSPVDFGTGPNAGYWPSLQTGQPVEIIVPPELGGAVGKTLWYRVTILEALPHFPFPEYVAIGASKVYSMTVTNVVMRLVGLESFRLEPERLRIRREGDQVVIEWRYRGARYYSLEAASCLEPSAQWYPVFWSSNYAPAGTVFSVTNTVTGTPQFYRLWRSR
jgi:hypothetical protein